MNAVIFAKSLLSTGKKVEPVYKKSPANREARMCCDCSDCSCDCCK